MRFARVEDLLGRDIVDEVQRAVSNAYQTRGADHEAFCALRELLVGMLAALVTSERHLLVAQQLAAEDAAHLNALVRKVQEISMPPTTAAITLTSAKITTLIRDASAPESRPNRMVIHSAPVTAPDRRSQADR